MKNLLTHENLVSTPIGEGDAGIILKSDGTFRIFNCSKIAEDGTLTQEQAVQGTKMMALAAALSIPAIMDMLIQLSTDPAIVGEDGVDMSGVTVN